MPVLKRGAFIRASLGAPPGSAAVLFAPFPSPVVATDRGSRAGVRGVLRGIVDMCVEAAGRRQQRQLKNGPGPLNTLGSLWHCVAALALSAAAVAHSVRRFPELAALSPPVELLHAYVALVGGPGCCCCRSWRRLRWCASATWPTMACDSKATTKTRRMSRGRRRCRGCVGDTVPRLRPLCTPHRRCACCCRD
ncbi:hypothetical protein MTO96_007850 [Rhipicephalus appendiculatus]